jgi:tetratricopeptide (TPR) repeat protein
MKSEHRHELKTNELADWLENLPQWASKNSKTIMGLSAIIVVIVALYGWRVYDVNVLQAQRLMNYTTIISNVADAKGRAVAYQSMGSDGSYLISDNIKDLQNLVDKTGNRNMAALALIKEGEALRASEQYRSTESGKEQFAAQINSAKKAYEQAVSKSTNSEITAAAKFGLGLCEEELGKFEDAKKIYQEIAANPEFAYTTASVSVQIRLKTISDYQGDIVFKPRPQQAAPVPMIISPADANKPADTNVPVTMTILPPAETNAPKAN